MKKHICRILLLVAVAFSFSTIDGQAQALNDSVVDNEIKALDAEIRLKQKRILELKLQKLKQLEKDTQNELKSLENSDSTPVFVKAVSPAETEIVTESKKPGGVINPNRPEIPTVSIPNIEALKSKIKAAPNFQNQLDDPKCNNITMTNRSTFDNKLCVITKQFWTNADQPNLMSTPDELAVLFMGLAQTDENIKNLLVQLENTRTDKQVGGDSTNKGTTSLAVKGGAPKIIGWAIENGAATSDISGNSVNIRVNPIGLLEALASSSNQLPFGNRFANPITSPINFKVEDSDDSFTKFAKRASLGLSFDTTRGTDPPTFIGSKQQLSAVSFRYEFINHRNPLRPEFNEDWNEFFQSQISNLTGQVNAVSSLITFDARKQSDIFRNAELQKWVEVTETELKAIPIDPITHKRNFTKIREKIEERLKVLPINEVLKDVSVKGALTSLAESGAKYSTASKEFLNKLNKGTIVTFEYTNSRNVNAPDTSNFNFIAEFGKKFGDDGVMDITFNGSLTMFNKKPADATVKRIKDFNFALQADFPLPKSFLENSVLSFSGKYTRQQGDVVLPNGLTASGTKGDIAVGQAKLTIPIPDWGIRFPLSITFANRTELVKESTVRGNVGITFDLDSIFGKRKIF